MIKNKLIQRISPYLKEWGDTGEDISLMNLIGGSINKSYRVKTKQNTYFMKVQEQTRHHFFTSETKGLKALRETEAIKVPDVYFCHDTEKEGTPSILITEWIKEVKGKDSERRLGENLAKLHSCSLQESYGLDYDNYIGTLNQENGWHNSWSDYYINKRIKPQLQLGVKLKTIHGRRHENLLKLMDDMKQWIPSQPEVSLLHGDLWGGNWMSDSKGEPVLIDPAILFGHSEMDLAFTELFGGYSPSFYKAYTYYRPLGQDYEDRKELYQLFYLLIHLNIFGEGYGSSVDRILLRFQS